MSRVAGRRKVVKCSLTNKEVAAMLNASIIKGEDRGVRATTVL
jgi:hypothetical protein